MGCVWRQSNSARPDKMFTEVEKFLNEILSRIQKAGVDVTVLELDHIAYKTSSLEEYEKIKPDFLKFGKMIKENMVRERKVGHIKLFKPIIYKQYVIPALEVIAPKTGEIIKPGWEHVEFVLKESYEQFMSKYPSLNWDTSVMTSDVFSMIKLILGEDMQVKFHMTPLLEMVEEDE
jgi:uncharacterized protein